MTDDNPSKPECEVCRGSGRLDDRGFPDVGQPAFSFQPCPECAGNPAPKEPTP